MYRRIWLILGAVIFISLYSIFNLSSNIEYLFNQNGVLRLKQGSNWVEYNGKVKIQNTSKIIYQNKKVEIREVKLQRSNYGLFHGIENILNPNNN